MRIHIQGTRVAVGEGASKGLGSAARVVEANRLRIARHHGCRQQADVIDTHFAQGGELEVQPGIALSRIGIERYGVVLPSGGQSGAGIAGLVCVVAHVAHDAVDILTSQISLGTEAQQIGLPLRDAQRRTGVHDRHLATRGFRAGAGTGFGQQAGHRIQTATAGHRGHRVPVTPGRQALIKATVGDHVGGTGLSLHTRRRRKHIPRRELDGILASCRPLAVGQVGHATRLDPNQRRATVGCIDVVAIGRKVVCAGKVAGVDDDRIGFTRSHHVALHRVESKVVLRIAIGHRTAVAGGNKVGQPAVSVLLHPQLSARIADQLVVADRVVAAVVNHHAMIKAGDIVAVDRDTTGEVIQIHPIGTADLDVGRDVGQAVHAVLRTRQRRTINEVVADDVVHIVLVGQAVLCTVVIQASCVNATAVIKFCTAIEHLVAADGVGLGCANTDVAGAINHVASGTGTVPQPNARVRIEAAPGTSNCVVGNVDALRGIAAKINACRRTVGHQGAGNAAGSRTVIGHRNAHATGTQHTHARDIDRRGRTADGHPIATRLNDRDA